MKSLSDEIREKAYFVAGSKAYFRPENDPRIETVIDFANGALSKLSSKAQANMGIHAGTTAHPDTVVSALWVTPKNDGIGAVSVSFNKNATYTIERDQETGHDKVTSDFSNDEPLNAFISGINSGSAHRVP